jgi:hypothetical protein
VGGNLKFMYTHCQYCKSGTNFYGSSFSKPFDPYLDAIFFLLVYGVEDFFYINVRIKVPALSYCLIYCGR